MREFAKYFLLLLVVLTVDKMRPLCYYIITKVNERSPKRKGDFKMTVKELKELLNTYEDSDEVRYIVTRYANKEITDLRATLNNTGERFVLIF